MAQDEAVVLSALGQPVSAGKRLWGLGHLWFDQHNGRVQEGDRLFFVNDFRIKYGGRAGRCYEFTPAQSSRLWPSSNSGYYRQVFEVEEFQHHNKPLQTIPVEPPWFMGNNVLKRRRVQMTYDVIASIEAT